MVLLVEHKDNVVIATLNRPKARNALSPELVVRLAGFWDQVRADDHIRAVILTGAAGSTFCAGFDLARSIPLLTGAREAEDEWDEAFVADRTLAHKATLRGYDLERPLIVAANGHAIAGGMELLLAADLHVVAAGAKLGLSEVKLGLIPGMGGSALINRHMAGALAAEILLTGDNISAEAGRDGGFVNRVVAGEAVLDTALELAEAIAGNAPLAVRAARAVLRAAGDLSATEALAFETEQVTRLAATEDAKEGPRAFLEKRPPLFRGK